MARIKISKKGISIIIISLVVIILAVVLGIFMIKKTGGETPVDLTKDFMNKYKKADSEVMSKVKYPYDDELTETQLARYKELIKTQYLALDYNIVDETVGEVDAIIKVEFEVLDYQSSYDKATSYLNLYGEDLSREKQVDYKLKEMSSTKEKIKYSIEFSYYKLDGKWIMTELSEADYAKLTGTF